MKLTLLKVRGSIINGFHLVVIALSLTVAFLLRFEFSLGDAETSLLIQALMVAIPIKMAIFFAGSLQQGSWRYAGLMDLVRLYLVNLAASGLSVIGISLWVGPQFPRSVHIIDFLLCFLISSAARFSVRLYLEGLKAELASGGKGILVYGAGAAGRTLVREVRMNPSLGLQVIGFIDDNPILRSRMIMNVPVLGSGRNIAAIADRYRNRTPHIHEVIIAMSSATGRQMQQAHANCRAAGVTCRTIPGMADLLNGKYLTSQIRSISLEDLLGRKPIWLEEDRIQASIAGKSIMVTGAAGSIGSELCRQTARFFPRRIVTLDQAESDLFKIEQQLRQQHPNVEIIPVVADIRDIQSVEDVIRTHSIESIYHAAAYKHVPMMEHHVAEAVRNNIIGTWNVAMMAHKHRVADFLMISTDKAVNPTSVMGVTKRIAELIVASFCDRQDSGTRFVSVRFGNVLGSNGSVVPIFQSQIASGGPITVTHPEIRRYFMSIREAVQLVLQASTMGKGSEIFVLDMGEPVRILDLALNMIQLAGFVPNEDIEIRFTGLRPGEKLFEEIKLDGENMMPTHHDKIKIFKGPSVQQDNLSAWLAQLQLLVARKDVKRVLRHFTVLVPEYQSQQLQEAIKLEELRSDRATGFGGSIAAAIR